MKLHHTKPNVPDWNSAPEFGRRESILTTLRTAYRMLDKPPLIVEIGTSRNESPAACGSDGWSTRAWGWYATLGVWRSASGVTGEGDDGAAITCGHVITVDIDPNAIEACKRITAEWADVIEYVVSDSLEFFRNYNLAVCGPIDLLYLDGLDYFDRVASEQRQLEEAQTALPLLAPTCLVLFDDTSAAEEQGNYGCAEGTTPTARELRLRRDDCADYLPLCTGKGALAVPFLLQNGFAVAHIDPVQILLARE
jgi:hypothetical protein